MNEPFFNNLWEQADWYLAKAQAIVEQCLLANDDSQYGLLASAKEHILSARGDLDADLK